MRSHNYREFEQAIAPRSPTFDKSRGSCLEFQVLNLKFLVSNAIALPL
ncbi:hypothetical protein ACE1AT_04410 [Pelatocladus sp. BLCC-F211]